MIDIRPTKHIKKTPLHPMIPRQRNQSTATAICSLQTHNPGDGERQKKKKKKKKNLEATRNATGDPWDVDHSEPVADSDFRPPSSNRVAAKWSGARECGQIVLGQTPLNSRRSSAAASACRDDHQQGGNPPLFGFRCRSKLCRGRRNLAVV